MKGKSVSYLIVVLISVWSSLALGDESPRLSVHTRIESSTPNDELSQFGFESRDGSVFRPSQNAIESATRNGKTIQGVTCSARSVSELKHVYSDNSGQIRIRDLQTAVFNCAAPSFQILENLLHHFSRVDYDLTKATSEQHYLIDRFVMTTVTGATITQRLRYSEIRSNNN